MTIFGPLSLGFAAFVYLVPLQIALHQPIHTGYRGLGVAIAVLFFSLLFWLSVLSAWCVLLAHGSFAWLGGGRGWQFCALFVSWLALAATTTLAMAFRGDPQIPGTLRPLMPWAPYVLPILVLGATAVLMNGDLSARPQLAATSRFILGFCGAVALLSAGGVAVQYAIQQSREHARAARRDPANRDKVIRRIVREVEALDPQKDLALLLSHAARDRLEEPRALARKKIASHPRLNKALAGILRQERPHEALGYLEVNTPPQLPSLAEPVHEGFLGMAAWIRAEIEKAPSLNRGSFFNDTAMILEVADKFVKHRADHRAAIRELRNAFDHPKAAGVGIDAVRLLDDWLRDHPLESPAIVHPSPGPRNPHAAQSHIARRHHVFTE